MISFVSSGVGEMTLSGAGAAADATGIAAEADGDSESFVFEGPVKWFDATRGFGFVVSDHGDGLVHFSLLRPHARRTLPEGATVSGAAFATQRGLQASIVDTIDLSSATGPDPESRVDRRARGDPLALLDEAGPFETVSVKWFNRLKGYGFVVRPEADEDIFIWKLCAAQALPMRRPNKSCAYGSRKGTRGRWWSKRNPNDARISGSVGPRCLRNRLRRDDR